MAPNTVPSFRKNKWVDSEKTYTKTGWTGWKDRPLIHRTLLAMSGSPTRETTKKLYTRQKLLVGGNRHDTGRGQEVACIRSLWSQFLGRSELIARFASSTPPPPPSLPPILLPAQFRTRKSDISGAERWSFDNCWHVVIRTDRFFSRSLL